MSDIRLGIGLVAFYLMLMSCSTKKISKINATQEKLFEGVVTYRHTPVKPDMISEEEWKEQIKQVVGDQGFILQKNYYAPNQYAAEINSGLEVGMDVYNPKDSLHYAWKLESNEAKTINNQKESVIKIKEFIALDTMALINDIECSAIEVKLTFGNSIVWYNPNILKIDGDTYRGTLFSKKLIQHIGCLPMKMEVPGMLSTEIFSFEEKVLDKKIFHIPEFEKIFEIPTF